MVVNGIHLTCAYAAINGHLNILIWARQNGCDWNFVTCSHAVSGGHLEVLIWARENSCEWDSNTEKLAKIKWPEYFS